MFQHFYILKIPYMWIVKKIMAWKKILIVTLQEKKQLIYAGIAINTIKGDFPVIILELNEKVKNVNFYRKNFLILKIVTSIKINVVLITTNIVILKPMENRSP